MNQKVKSEDNSGIYKGFASTGGRRRIHSLLSFSPRDFLSEEAGHWWYLDQQTASTLIAGKILMGVPFPVSQEHVKMQADSNAKHIDTRPDLQSCQMSHAALPPQSCEMLRRTLRQVLADVKAALDTARLNNKLKDGFAAIMFLR